MKIMKIRSILLWSLPLFICIGCKNKANNRVIFNEYQNGYVLQDKNDRIDIVKDISGGGITISRGDRVICVIETSFPENNEKFWDSSKLMNDPLYSGGLLIDNHMNGLPDQLFLGSQLKKRHDGLVGPLNLNTFIVDEEGNPLIRVRSVDGILVLDDVHEKISGVSPK